jgi:ribosomal protein L37E
MKTKETCNHCNKEKNGVQTGLCNHCGRFGKNNRELALEWWNNLPTWGISSKEYYMGLHYSDDNVTDERIEEIWIKETKPNYWKNLPNTMMKAKALNVALNNKAKANNKQFKEFNPELFKAYINKFSDEDKLKALKIVFFAQTKKCPITLASSMLEYCDE